LRLKVQDFHATPRLVFLHGWGVNCGVFEGLIAELNDSYGVRFIDLPGFGQNNHIDISGKDFAAFCAMIIPYIPNNAVLVGWSLGGLVAQYCAQSQVKLAGLVSICSTPHFVENGDWPGIKPKVLSNFQAQLNEDFLKTVDRFLAIQAMGSATARQDLKTIRQRVLHYGLPNPGALKTGLQFLQEVDLRQDLDSELATLRIFGSQDSLVPKNAMAFIRAIQPSAQCQLIEKASHAPFISHPEAFLDVLRKFLTQLPGF